AGKHYATCRYFDPAPNDVATQSRHDGGNRSGGEAMRLSAEQQRTLAEVAARLPPEKHRVFFERCEAMLNQRRGHGGTADHGVSEAAELALASLLVAHKAS